jgi:putative ABC transport system permease protein
MQELFGIPMVNIMAVMLGLLFACLAVIAFIAWRRPVIFKLGVRNIPRRKAQTVLIVVGLMLSTLIIAAAFGTGDTLNHSVSTAVYNQLGPVDEIVVASSDGDGEGEVDSIITQTIPDSALNVVRDLTKGRDDVDAVGGILVAPAPAVNIADNNPDQITSLNQLTDIAVQSEPFLMVAGLDTESYEALGGVTDLNGHRVDFGAFSDTDVLLSETGATKLDAKVGDHLVVMFNNKPVVLTVAAIAEDSVLTGSFGQQDGPAMAMQLAPLQKLSGREGLLSGIGISNRGGERDGLHLTDNVVDALKPELAKHDLGINPIKQDFVNQAELLANIFVTFFIVFGLFSIAVGILLIVLIFTMLAAERRSEMGMERAVGAQRRQLIQQFIAEGAGYALLAGLVGAALGVVAALAIGYGLQAAFGDFIDISPHVEPRSMVIAYSLGVVITFLAVTISSWRVSRLNVVAAVRDIPDAYTAHRNRRQLVWGVLMVIVGALMILAAQGSDSLALFTIGMSLVPFGLAAIVTFFGWHPRWVLTVVGIYLLVFWLLPGDLFDEIFGHYNGDIEMFFVSGICIVAASTLVIVQNMDWFLSIAERLGARAKTWLPSIRLASSYPSANKGRTGMTIAMFSLIVFSLVVISVINENFSAAFTSDKATAGWDVSVTTTPTNPVDDLEARLKAEGYDTSAIAAIGLLTTPDEAPAMQFLAPGEKKAEGYPIQVANDAYLDNADLTFQAKANGYGDDQAIIEALKTDPNVMVIDSFALSGNQGFGTPEGLTLDIPATGTYDAPVVEVQSPDGTTHQVKVIGVIDSSISTLFGIIVGPPAGNAVFTGGGEPSKDWLIKLNPGVNTTEAAREIERRLLPYGAQAEDIRQQIEDSQGQQRSFLYILQGFMGLGLIVGIAAVGVIAFRAVVERRQQIGMLRAIGFQRTTVARAFVLESAMTVILGVLAGGVTGLILSYSLITSDDFSQGVESTFIVPWNLIIITLVTTVVAALLMAWIPARQAARVVPAEALRYE